MKIENQIDFPNIPSIPESEDEMVAVSKHKLDTLIKDNKKLARIILDDVARHGAMIWLFIAIGFSLGILTFPFLRWAFKP
jgi:hypothetical protein